MTKRIKLTWTLREACFTRDNWTCRACGCHDETGHRTVHAQTMERSATYS